MRVDTLLKIHEVAGAVLRVIESGRGGGLTVENAFDHPDVVALRDQLLELLCDDSGIDDALDALSEEFDCLHALPSSDENLVKMGALAAAGRALSYDELRRAADPVQVFAYTLTRVWPYLEVLAKLGVLAVGAAA